MDSHDEKFKAGYKQSSEDFCIMMANNQHYRERVFNQIIAQDIADGLYRFYRATVSKPSAFEAIKTPEQRFQELAAEALRKKASLSGEHASSLLSDCKNAYTGELLEAAQKLEMKCKSLQDQLDTYRQVYGQVTEALDLPDLSGDIVARVNQLVKKSEAK